ncbi:MAG: tetratricopeptide repeat protein, partial [Paludibacter sp.]|nr:tetratricopeptide repeat protein [Paludibacter sp.]
MKKIILSMALVMSVAGAFGQQANVSKAKSKAQSGDYAGARELIKLALDNPETANLAETWYVAGFIGEKENNALWGRAVSNLEYDKNAKGKAMLSSIDYYIKADELGQIPDEKGKVKNKYRKDMAYAIKGYYNGEYTNCQLYDYFATLYDDKQFQDAYNVAQVYFSIPQLPMMQQQKFSKDSTFFAMQYYAGSAASSAGLYNEAIAIYKKSIADNYESLNSYACISDAYDAMKDTVNLVKALKDGVNHFPKEPWFLQKLINLYSGSNQNAEAIKYLDDAIANEPNNVQYYSVKANLENRLGNFDLAEQNFNKALEIDPNYADAYAGKGLLIFYQGIQIAENAGEIRDNAKYKAEMDKATFTMQQSLPLLEKA